LQISGSCTLTNCRAEAFGGILRVAKAACKTLTQSAHFLIIITTGKGIFENSGGRCRGNVPANHVTGGEQGFRGQALIADAALSFGSRLEGIGQLACMLLGESCGKTICICADNRYIISLMQPCGEFTGKLNAGSDSLGSRQNIFRGNSFGHTFMDFIADGLSRYPPAAF
jgi:hypothetical protein